MTEGRKRTLRRKDPEKEDTYAKGRSEVTVLKKKKGSAEPERVWITS